MRFLPMLALAFSIAVPSENESVTVLIRKGQAALDAGDFVSAAYDFERARQIAPESLDVNRGLLLSYLQENSLDDAEKVGRSAIAQFPRDSQLLHWLGLAYFKQGQNPEALETLRRAEKIENSKADIHFDTALVLLSDNRYPDAADELEKA